MNSFNVSHISVTDGLPLVSHHYIMLNKGVSDHALLSQCDTYPNFHRCLPYRSSMEILSGPWADVALLLRQTLTGMDGETRNSLPLWLFILVLFLSVCLLLLQLIIYLSWKLRQGRHVINFASFHFQSMSRPITMLYLLRSAVSKQIQGNPVFFRETQTKNTYTHHHIVRISPSNYTPKDEGIFYYMLHYNCNTTFFVPREFFQAKSSPFSLQTCQ